MHIVLQIVCALAIAMLLNQKLKARAVFRAVFFLPVVVSGVVILLIVSYHA